MISAPRLRETCPATGRLLYVSLDSASLSIYLNPAIQYLFFFPLTRRAWRPMTCHFSFDFTNAVTASFSSKSQGLQTLQGVAWSKRPLFLRGCWFQLLSWSHIHWESTMTVQSVCDSYRHGASCFLLHQRSSSLLPSLQQYTKYKIQIRKVGNFDLQSVQLQFALANLIVLVSAHSNTSYHHGSMVQ